MNTSKYDISVIIPVYNVEKYLHRCVDSVVNQEGVNIEVILVDDGSSDSSGKICDEYSDARNNVVVIHQANTGQGIARNAGIDIAKGEYLAFLDSDDYMSNDCYRHILQEIRENNADACAFSYNQYNPDGSECYKATVHKDIYTGDDIKNRYVLHFFGDSIDDDNMRGVSSCMTVYKKSIIINNSIRFKSERKVFGEDTLFNLDFCKFANCIITIPEIYYHYCLKSDSFSHGYMENRLERAESFCNILAEYSRDYEIAEIVSKRINMVLWISIMDCIKQELIKNQRSTIGNTIRSIRRIVLDARVQKNAKEINYSSLKITQRVLLFCLRFKLVIGVIVLGKIRLMRGIR